MADRKQVTELMDGLIRDGLWSPRRVGSLTREEAEAFLERNPRIADTMRDILPTLQKLESYYLWGKADNEEDARINLIEVARAMGWVTAASR